MSEFEGHTPGPWPRELLRVMKERDACLEALQEALEYFEEIEDTRDTEFGPRANEAMSRAILIRAAIALCEKSQRASQPR